MMSVDRATSGTSSRRRSIFARYASTVYPRRIARSIRSDPDWTGRCRYSQTERHSAIARKSSSWASNGWLVVNRTRSIEVFRSIARRRAGKSPGSRAASGSAGRRSCDGLQLKQGAPAPGPEPAGAVREPLAV